MKAAVSLLLAVLLLAAPALAGERVVVILANYLSLDDILSAGPNTRSLIEDGSIGLMNTGTRVRSPDIRYLTLGTGIRPMGANGMAVCYEADEVVDGIPAANIYRNQMGRTASSGSVVCLGFSRIARANQKPPFRSDAVGLLGDSFHEAGLKTAVIGSSNEHNRMAGLIAMDRNGLVDSHSASGTTHGLVVIEPPWFNELEDMRELLSERAYELQRAQNLQKLDRLIGVMRPTDGTLIVCSPAPSSEGSSLTPIVIFRPHGWKGLLTSGTTRTDGLISSVDVAPTILHQADLPVPSFVTGRPVEAIASADPIEHLRRMEQVVTQQYRIRIPVLAAIGVLAILAVTIAEITLGRRRPARKALMPIFLFLLALPASLLIVDGFRVVGILQYLGALILTAIALAGLSQAGSALARNRISPLPILLGATALLILADIFTGAHLIQRSMLTCNPIVGLRYYGLGNEYMGMLVASALLFPVLLWRPKGMSIPALIWFAIVTLAIGYPSLGADVGGLLTAIATFGVAWITLSGVKFRARHAIILIVLAMLGVGLLFFVDTGDRVSHFGRSMSLAREYGWQWLRYLIAGKMLMHLGILKTPQVQYPILGSIPFLVLYGRRMKSETTGKMAVRTAGFPALVVGIIVAFLFNDSGVVPAGLMLATYMVTILCLRLQEAK